MPSDSQSEILKLVFRGLMVFHKTTETINDADGNKKSIDCFEIGILPASGHFLRINTLRNEKRVGVFFLDPADTAWRLDLPNPKGVTTFKDDNEFSRLNLPISPDRDFRWIVDLESKEFYGEDLTVQIKNGMRTPLIPRPGGGV